MNEQFEIVVILEGIVETTGKLRNSLSCLDPISSLKSYWLTVPSSQSKCKFRVILTHRTSYRHCGMLFLNLTAANWNKKTQG